MRGGAAGQRRGQGGGGAGGGARAQRRAEPVTWPDASIAADKTLLPCATWTRWISSTGRRLGASGQRLQLWRRQYREALARSRLTPTRRVRRQWRRGCRPRRVRDRLLAASDRVLAVEKAASVRAHWRRPTRNRSATPSAMRYRRAMGRRLPNLQIGRPRTQPPGFAAFLGGNRAIRLEQRRDSGCGGPATTA